MKFETLEKKVITKEEGNNMLEVASYKTRIKTEQSDGTWKVDANDTVDPVETSSTF